MFNPTYKITPRILRNIKQIGEITGRLSTKKFPGVIIYDFEKTANALSTHTSTGIEGNPLPLTEVRKILKNKPDNLRDSEKEVLNYNKALVKLNRDIREGSIKITKELILDIQKTVTKGLISENNSGKFRKEGVIIQNPVSGEVVFIPPDWKEVETMITDLLEYLNTHTKTVDHLILSGILHKQMVIIHPFVDGNGRTTRLLTKALLAQMGLNTFNLFSFENYYHRNISKYFQTVGEFGDYYEIQSKIDFTNWLEYFTDGIIDELLRVEKQLSSFPKVDNFNLKPHQVKILRFISENDHITNTQYASIVNRKKSTRVKDLQELVELKILEKRGGGRSTYYILKESSPTSN